MDKRYNEMSITEAQETAKQRHRALATALKRNIREAEAKGINNVFSKEPSMVYKWIKAQGDSWNWAKLEKHLGEWDEEHEPVNITKADI